MHFSSDHLVNSESQSGDGLREREFSLDGIPGILWTPAESASTPLPLILLGHPGGLRAMRPRLAARARRLVAAGFAAATIELPGSGERPRLPAAEQARADLRSALAAGQPVQEIVERLVGPLVELAVPEWQAALDALRALPELAGPVGYSGGLIAIGVRLSLVERRVSAASFFAGSFVPAATFDEARKITIPLHVLLQWDDQGNDRQLALDLFDAFGSKERTLYASMGGHTGVPQYAGEDAVRFFVRHLRRPGAAPRDAKITDHS